MNTIDNHLTDDLEALITSALKDTLSDPCLAGISRPRDFPSRWGMSKSSVYRRMVNDPDFPKPIQIDDGGGIGFWSAEVAEYFRNKPRINRYKAAKQCARRTEVLR